MSPLRGVVLTWVVLTVMGSAGCGWPFVMEDAEAPKSSKKRKKEADSDGEGPKVSNYEPAYGNDQLHLQ